MKSVGSFVALGLITLSLSSVAGCKKDEPPKPDPASQTSTSRSKLNVRNPTSPLGKVDPQSMKDYRVDICYYGTLSLRQARDAYLASMGTAEPSEKKIPNLGVPLATSAQATPAASGSAAAGKPSAAPTAKPSAAPTAQPNAQNNQAKPAASGAPSAAPTTTGMPLNPDRRPEAIMLRVPHERNARACIAGAALKEPPMGAVDEAMAQLAPFAGELAKDITAAHQYYSREEYKKDNFAKGKELDKKLREGFAKLDAMQDKLGDALASWRKDHPLDTSKLEEGERDARGAIDDARNLYTMVFFKKADGDAWKAALEALDKDVAAMKAYASGHAADPWAKIMVGPLEAFQKTVKESKVTADKTFESEAILTLVGNFTGLVEARQRSLSRVSMSRPVPGAAGSGAPAPALPPDHPR